jgi:transcription elongation factor GreA
MNGRISEESPFGKALLGKKSGEEVLVDAPAGMLHYRVVGIQK